MARTVPERVRKASLPSRGAWIEMLGSVFAGLASTVAPLAGSVDRNSGHRATDTANSQSLPSRGAWIEILLLSILFVFAQGRSPRGERG